MANVKCRAGDVPVVRLALKKQACARDTAPINMPDKVVQYMKDHYGCQPQEYAVAIALNSQMGPLTVIEVSQGAVEQAMVDPKVLFSALLLSGATAFIFFHNHPSGNPEPSQADVDLTRQLNNGAKILGIRLVDHMVLGAGDNVVSFYSRGLLKY